MKDFNKIEVFEDMAGRLNGRLNEKTHHGLKMAYRAACFMDDEEEMGELESDLRHLMLSTFPEKIPAFIPPGRDEAFGEIEMGRVLSGERESCIFGLVPDEVIRHLLITGATGTGKTTLAQLLVTQLHEKKIPVMVFDLMLNFKCISDDIDAIVIKLGDFRWNPLRPPPGVEPLSWCQRYTEIISENSNFMQGSGAFIQDQILKLYELYGVLDGGDNYPAFPDLNELLCAASYSPMSKYSRYLETTRNQVKLMLNSIGETLDVDKGYPIEELLERNVIFELNEVSHRVQSFFIESMLCWIYEYRLANRHGGKLLHCNVIDEAKRIFDINKEKRVSMGVPNIDILTSRIRQLGEALIVLDQEPSKLTDSIKANSYLKATFNLGSGKDIFEMSRCMGLSPQQAEDIYNLNTRECIVRLSGRYNRPFKVRVTPFESKKRVSDEVIEKRSDVLISQLKSNPRTRPPEFEEYLVGLASRSKKTGRSKVDVQLNEAKQKSQFLVSVYEKPFIPVSERYRLSGLSPRKGTDYKNEFVSKGYLREVELNLGKNGGRKIFLELLPPAVNYLEQALKKKITLWKGGFLHGYYQHKVKEAFESQGHKVGLEYAVEDGNIDLVVDEKFAFEIAMSSGYESHNIRKCLNSGFKRIYMLCRNEEVRAKIKGEFNRLFMEKPEGITFHLLNDFLVSGNKMEDFPSTFH